MSRVLIVDDHEDNLYYLEALLTGGGWEVVSARHGAEALVKARMAPPDLVVSDLLMPVMDGYTLLRHWKFDPSLRAIPFVVYTATYTAPEDEQLALDLGADAFVLKPAEPEELVARLRAVERQRGDGEVRRPIANERDDRGLLESYHASLIRKLEEKTMQLELANQALQQDLAERARVEAKLREQATLLDKAQDAILVCDLEHRVRYWNQSAARLYGWTAEEAIGRTVVELQICHEADLVAAHAAVLAAGEWTGELEQANRQGRRLTVESRWTLLRGEGDAVPAIFAVNTDCTQRKKIEARFLRAQRMESIGTMAAGIAHDLNNILAPILMSVELLRARRPQEDQATLATLESCCRRGGDLVRQVLSFARGVSGQRIALDVRPLAKELVAVLRETFPRNIDLQYSAAPDLWQIAGDPVQIHQVLLNLCVNARDAMPDGGTLNVALSNCLLDEERAADIPDGRPGAFVRLAVADQGIGIPAEIRATIFEPFFTTKEIGKGSGLGLATTLAIVRSHEGFIDVQSEPGQGAELAVYLPAATTSAPTGSTASESRSTPGSGQALLVVDDEPAMREILGESLRRAGYRVTEAQDGQQALDLFDHHGGQFAAVITDLAMPNLDGMSLIRAVRARNGAIPILGTTGLAPGDRAAQPTDAGANALLLKPFTLESLLAAVHAVLSPAPNDLRPA